MDAEKLKGTWESIANDGLLPKEPVLDLIRRAGELQWKIPPIIHCDFDNLVPAKGTVDKQTHGALKRLQDVGYEIKLFSKSPADGSQGRANDVLVRKVIKDIRGFNRHETSFAILEDPALSSQAENIFTALLHRGPGDKVNNVRHAYVQTIDMGQP